MIFIFSKKLDDQGISNALKLFREGRGREREKAFLDLRETFLPLILSIFNKVKKNARSVSEAEMIRSFIESTFAEILLSERFDYDNVTGIKAKIKKILSARINQDTVKNELGYTPIVRDLRRIESDMGRAISKFLKKNKRYPDLLRDEKDIKEIANILNKSVQDVKEYIEIMGPNKVKSLSTPIGGEEGENVKTLMDTLQSKTHLPDKVLHDKMLMKTLFNVIKKDLSKDEQRAFMLFYDPLDKRRKDLDINEIANEMNSDYRKVRYLLDKGRSKIRKSPVLKEMLASAEKAKFTKLALSAYKIVNNNGKFGIVANCKNNSEELITEIVEKYAS